MEQPEKIRIPDDQVEQVLSMLQEIGGWRHRSLPSLGHWIELADDADQARAALKLTI